MRPLAELKEKHVNKKITVHAPEKYFNANGMYFDQESFLKDNNADCVYYFSQETQHLMPEQCFLNFHPSAFESWNIVISDWDGQTAN